MSGHTPGPWAIDPDYCDDVQAPDGLDVATTGPFLNRMTPSAERRANARLIAAAPEMLGVLMAHDAYMLDAGYEGPEDTALHPKAAENWRNVRAIIAKATTP